MRKGKNISAYLYYAFTVLFTGLTFFCNSNYVQHFVHSLYEDYETRFPEDSFRLIEGVGVFSYLPGFVFACIAQIMIPITLLSILSAVLVDKSSKSLRYRLKSSKANYLQHYIAPYAFPILIFEELSLEKMSPVFFARFYHFTPSNPLREVLRFDKITDITRLLMMFAVISLLTSIFIDVFENSTIVLRRIANTFAIALILWATALNCHTVITVFANCIWPFIFLYTLLLFTEMIILSHSLFTKRESKAKKEDAEKKKGVIVPLYREQTEL